MNYGLCKMRPCGNTTLYKYAHCKTTDDYTFRDRRYKLDTDDNFDWKYVLLNLPGGVFHGAKIRQFDFDVIDWLGLVNGEKTFGYVYADSNYKMFNGNEIYAPNITWSQFLFSNNTQYQRFSGMYFNFPNLKHAYTMFMQNYSMNPNFKINIPKAENIAHLCNDVRLLTTWKYPLSSAVTAYNAFGVYKNQGRMTKFEVPLPKVVDAHNMFTERHTLKETRYPIDEDGNCIYESGKEQITNENGNLMYKYLTLPKLSNGENMFNTCQLDRPSTISILSSLPTYTSGSHLITMGTHIDNKAEAETEGTELHTLINTTVPNKGWTLTMQYNGTLSTGIATLDLDPIYAKIEENEYGMYKNDETGKCYDLSWGNIIKSPDGKSPVEMGYEECYSVDEIIEKYNLRYIESEEVKLPPFEEELNNTEQ